jgi:hypothetical protein
MATAVSSLASTIPTSTPAPQSPVQGIAHAVIAYAHDLGYGQGQGTGEQPREHAPPPVRMRLTELSKELGQVNEGGPERPMTMPSTRR